MNQSTFKLSNICKSCATALPLISINFPYFNAEQYNDLQLNTYTLDHVDQSQASEFILTTTINLIQTFTVVLDGLHVQVNTEYSRPVDCILNLDDKTILLGNYELDNRYSDNSWNSLELFFNSENVILIDEDGDNIELTPIVKDNKNQLTTIVENNIEGGLFLKSLEPNGQVFARKANHLIDQVVIDETKEKFRQLMLKAYELKLHETV